ncbi:DNA glycosylase AlkZ-like family protein [Kitasatospora sp. NPDC059973]|uniref:DNA glycosylase AlkZ-like family protein n=1 Tax=Kitasatospora sp. NPDC059973 TaxID=3347020 RepID=UPI0036B7E61F
MRCGDRHEPHLAAGQRPPSRPAWTDRSAAGRTGRRRRGGLPRWRQALPLAAVRGALCFGPDRGRQVTYTNPHRLLPAFTPAEPRTALDWLLRRYPHAYGPATPEHFAHWLAAPTRWAERLFTDDLVPVRLEGGTAWLPADDTDFPPAEPTGPRLLPYFDAYTVGCHPRDLLFPGPAATRALNRGQAGNDPVLLIDGTVAGVWHQRRTGRRVDITVEPLTGLTRRHRHDLDAQATRIGEILEATPTVTIGQVTTGPHA